MDPRHLPEDSVLDPDRDEQLIKGLEGYARVAGIGGHPEYIWQSVKDKKHVTRKDRVMVKNMPFGRNADHIGVVYEGWPLSVLTKKFMALTGLLVRNYINAKYIHVNRLLSELEEFGEFEGDVIFIPDFQTKKKTAGKHHPVPTWKRDALLGFLLECEAENVDVIIGIGDSNLCKQHWGAEIMDYINANFVGAEK